MRLAGWVGVCQVNERGLGTQAQAQVLSGSAGPGLVWVGPANSGLGVGAHLGGSVRLWAEGQPRAHHTASPAPVNGVTVTPTKSQ